MLSLCVQFLHAPCMPFHSPFCLFPFICWPFMFLLPRVLVCARVFRVVGVCACFVLCRLLRCVVAPLWFGLLRVVLLCVFAVCMRVCCVCCVCGVWLLCLFVLCLFVVVWCVCFVVFVLLGWFVVSVRVCVCSDC